MSESNVHKFESKKQKALNKIQSKMDALMDRLKEEPEQFLSYMVDSELLLTNYTLFNDIDNYEVSIDTYTATQGYNNENIIYCTDSYEEAERVHTNLLEALNNNTASYDDEGRILMM